MDGTRFDRLARGLARELTQAGTRRGVVAGLAALLTGVGVAASAAEAAPDRARRRRDDGARRDDPAGRDGEQPQDADRLGAQPRRKRRRCLKDGTRCTAQSGRQGDNCKRCCSRASVPRTGGGRRCACRNAGATCAENRQCCSKQCFEQVCLDCAATETTCSGAGCVDLQTDNDHCGTCDTACRVNRACVAGDCVANCGSGQTLCGDDCVNLQTDDANCGTCGEACGANESCAAGDCVCDAGFTDCGGVCVTTQTDDANCGTCDNACAAGQTCAAGVCRCTGASCARECCAGEICCPVDAPRCTTDGCCPAAAACGGGCCDATGFGCCQETCTDLTTTANCGSCGNACESSESCTDGACVAKACGAGGPCTVFVTSTTQTAAMGGLAGADAICQGLANDADAVVPAGTYKAWLSTDTVSPSMPTRFYQSPAPYQLPNGTVIANDWAQLIDGAIGAPIDINEQGVAVTSFPPLVWTLTRSDGTTRFDGTSGSSTCVDWTSTTAGLLSGGGEITSVNSRWTTAFGSSSCSNQFRLYCFQQS